MVILTKKYFSLQLLQSLMVKYLHRKKKDDIIYFEKLRTNAKKLIGEIHFYENNRLHW